LPPRIEKRRLRFLESASDGRGRPRDGKHGAEVFRDEGAALDRGKRAGDVFDAGERQSAVANSKGPRLRGVREKSTHGGLIRRGNEVEHGLAAGLGTGERRNEAEDDVELERGSIAAAVLRGKGFYGVARRSSESLRSIFLRAWIILRLRFALGFS
jgi:hypothetical protein